MAVNAIAYQVIYTERQEERFVIVRNATFRKRFILHGRVQSMRGIDGTKETKKGGKQTAFLLCPTTHENLSVEIWSSRATICRKWLKIVVKQAVANKRKDRPCIRTAFSCCSLF